VCSTCGAVRDVVVPDALERDLDSALTKLAKREGFALDHHRLDLIGRCASCK
jgi:Fe2+ or Zn2+ uptake regulation protein